MSKEAIEALEAARAHILDSYRIWQADDVSAVPPPKSGAGSVIAKIDAVLSTLPIAGEGKVKALDFNRQSPDGSMEIADSVLGEYWVWQIGESAFWANGKIPGRAAGSTVADAKAAAQADYETRILPAVITAQEGWQLVPVEFTQAHYERMIGRTLLNLDRSKFSKWKEHWEWMLNTAPAAPSSPGKDGGHRIPELTPELSGPMQWAMAEAFERSEATTTSEKMASVYEAVRATEVEAVDLPEDRAARQTRRERENTAFHVWWEESGHAADPIFTLTMENCAHSAWQARADITAALDTQPASTALVERGNLACPCTTFQQDEDCEVGYPSLLCRACEGRGITTVDKVVALAAEMMKVAEQVDQLEDPFAAWETIDLLKSENEQSRKALNYAADMLERMYPGYIDGSGPYNEGMAERDKLIGTIRALSSSSTSREGESR